MKQESETIWHAQRISEWSGY